MIYNNIDKLIMQAVKEQNEMRTETLRLIKAKFIEYKTSKGAKPIDDAIEISLLNKMVKQREESAEIYENAGRTEQAAKERQEIAIISEYLPAPVTKDDIEAEIAAIIESGVEPIKKNMGVIIKGVKAKYPAADGKIVSQMVSAKLV